MSKLDLSALIFLPKVTFYQDEKKEWRWKISAPGNIVGASTEGYKNQADCISNFKSVGRYITDYVKDHNL